MAYLEAEREAQAEERAVAATGVAAAIANVIGGSKGKDALKKFRTSLEGRGSVRSGDSPVMAEFRRGVKELMRQGKL